VYHSGDRGAAADGSACAGASTTGEKEDEPGGDGEARREIRIVEGPGGKPRPEILLREQTEHQGKESQGRETECRSPEKSAANHSFPDRDRTN
jgi:hypothetical protein